MLQEGDSHLAAAKGDVAVAAGHSKGCSLGGGWARQAWAWTCGLWQPGCRVTCMMAANLRPVLGSGGPARGLPYSDEPLAPPPPGPGWSIENRISVIPVHLPVTAATFDQRLARVRRYLQVVKASPAPWLLYRLTQFGQVLAPLPDPCSFPPSLSPSPFSP